MKYLSRIIRIICGTLLLSLMAAASSADEGCDRAVACELAAMFELDSLTYDIEVLSNHLEAEWTEEYDLILRPLTQKDPIGLFSVLATVSRGGETLASGQVRMRIRKFADVVVSNDRIRRSEVMDPVRMTIRRMEVTTLREQPVTSLEALDGFRAKRNLRLGTIITSAALEAIPDIERGHETLIVFKNDLCRVTAPGIALQSGLSGEYIKVKNKATNKIIMARVVDDNSVAVDP